LAIMLSSETKAMRLFGTVFQVLVRASGPTTHNGLQAEFDGVEAVGRDPGGAVEHYVFTHLLTLSWNIHQTGRGLRERAGTRSK